MSFIKNMFQTLVITGLAGGASVLGAEGARAFLDSVKKKKKKKLEEEQKKIDDDDDEEPEQGGEAKVV